MTQGPVTRKLPLYTASFTTTSDPGAERPDNEDTLAKGIIDNCASTYYVNSEFVKQHPTIFTQTPIPPRGVQVGGELRTQSTAIATFQIKVGLLPPETITAYVLPLGKFDFVLGLPWLERHNPHVDWKSKSYEFVRNGRTYLLHPARPPPRIRIATPQEFRKFMNEKDVSTYSLISKGNQNVVKRKDTWTEKGSEKIVVEVNAS